MALATQETPTIRRFSLNQGSAEYEPGLSMVIRSYFDWFLYLKPLLKHPNWFDRNFELTLSTMDSDPEIQNGPLHTIAETMFTLPPGMTYAKDQDPKTRLNFFRGNFHTKILLNCDLTFADHTPGPGFEGGIGDWLGNDLAAVKKSKAEFQERIAVRKNMSSLVDHLTEQIHKNNLNMLENPLTTETVANYQRRIAEGIVVERVQPDEAERSFALAELFNNFLRMKAGLIQLNDNEVTVLLTSVVKPFESPIPVITESLRVGEFKSKPIE